MVKTDISQEKNPDLRASLAALKRAGQMARQTVIQTNTQLVLVENGKIVKLTAEQLKQELGKP